MLDCLSQVLRNLRANISASIQGRVGVRAGPEGVQEAGQRLYAAVQPGVHQRGDRLQLRCELQALLRLLFQLGAARWHYPSCKAVARFPCLSPQHARLIAGPLQLVRLSGCCGRCCRGAWLLVSVTWLVSTHAYRQHMTACTGQHLCAGGIAAMVRRASCPPAEATGDRHQITAHQESQPFLGGRLGSKHASQEGLAQTAPPSSKAAAYDVATTTYAAVPSTATTTPSSAGSAATLELSDDTYPLSVYSPSTSTQSLK